MGPMEHHNRLGLAENQGAFSAFIQLPSGSVCIQFLHGFADWTIKELPIFGAEDACR